MFGMKGFTHFLGVSEQLFGALLLAGFWNKKLGVPGALGSVATSLFQTQDFLEGRKAEAEGRKPVYQGK